jgi:flagellar biosynthesis/type III secretory pathway protein FliH
VITQDFARILKTADAESAKSYQLEPAPASPGAYDRESRERSAYERGVAEGTQRARAEAADLLERQCQLLTALVQELRLTRDLWFKDAEEPIAALALAIVRKVLREQGDGLREAVVAQVREALAKVREGGPMKVLVNPGDASLLEEARETIATSFEGRMTLQVEADPRISSGGCLVETPSRVVDARIEVQLARIAEALRQTIKKEPNG